VNLSSSTLDVLVIAALSVAVLALLVTLILAFRMRKLRRSYTVLQGDGEHTSFVDAAQFTEVDTDIAQSVSRVAVVRFDAFEQLGGRLSFAAALLDDHGDGIVISSIHGRSETRVYAKGIRAGQSDHPITPEERQAIGRALGTISS